MSRGYYGIIDDVVYELEPPKGLLQTVETSIPISMNVHTYNHGNQTSVDIKLSNLDPAAPTNQEVWETAVAMIQNQKVTELKKLANSYKMYVAYRLVDVAANEVVDELIWVNDIAFSPVVFPLGLTSDNEYVMRLALSAGTSKFSRQYRSNVPYGITRTRNEKFVLFIDRIWITQKTVESFGIEPIEHTAISHDIEPVYGRECHHTHYGEHPSMITISPRNIDHVHEIVVYDTKDLGIAFDPVEIMRQPSQITVHVDVSLNHMFVTADRDDIETYLEHNRENEEEDVILPGDHEDDQTGIHPENPNDEEIDVPVIPDRPADTTPEETPSEDTETPGTEEPEVPTTDETVPETPDEETSEPTTEETPSEDTDPSETVPEETTDPEITE